MRTLDETIRSLGGLAATHELLAAGFTKRGLSAAAHHGITLRVRQGWYCTPDLPVQLQRSARVGGRLGCISGGLIHGTWIPPGERLHVSIERNDCRLRTPGSMTRRLPRRPTEIVTHWSTKRLAGSRLALDPVSCLEEVARCQPPEYAVAIADSALRATEHRDALLSLDAWRDIADRVFTRAGALRLADGVCESGTESIVWVRLAPFRLPIERQVWIDGHRVDFLVGRRLVVEVDGAAYHTDPIRFEADRSRDAQLCAINYIVLRFSYNQVLYRWLEVEKAILAAVARGDHL